MQAKLTTNEFAYLLHALSAQKIIGVNNAQLFPDKSEEQDILLSVGLQLLKEHGWLQPSDGDTFKTHTGLVLLIAVIASPEQTIMLTKAMPGNSRQTITYYFAQGMIVEQFYTADEQYLLTQIDTVTNVILRLQQALSIPDSLQTWKTTITLKADAFEQTMKQARNGDSSSLFATMRETNIDSNRLEELVGIVGGLQPAGNLEIATLSGGRLNSFQNIIILQAKDKSAWEMHSDDVAEFVYLQPLNAEHFIGSVRSLLEISEPIRHL